MLPFKGLSYIWLQQTNYRTVEVIDGCSKKDQCTNRPPILSNRLLVHGLWFNRLYQRQYFAR